MKDSRIALDTSFVLSILVRRDHTPLAVEALSWAQKRYQEIFIPQQVICELVYVLEGIHRYTPGRRRLSRREIREIVCSVLNTPKVVCERRGEVLEALDFYVDKGLSFGDAVIVARMRSMEIKDLLSFDEDFRGVEGIRVYPEKENG